MAGKKINTPYAINPMVGRNGRVYSKLYPDVKFEGTSKSKYCCPVLKAQR